MRYQQCDVCLYANIRIFKYPVADVEDVADVCLYANIRIFKANSH